MSNAPAVFAKASDISPRIMQALVEQVPVEDIVAGIRDMLSATFTTKAGNVNPDYRAREAGLKLYLNYVVGQPVARQLTADVSPPKPDADRSEFGIGKDRIRKSAVARESLRDQAAKTLRMLDEWDREDGILPQAEVLA